MDALYFIGMLVGVGWLAVWSVLPPGGIAERWWWPFDIREADAPAAEAAAPPPDPRRSGRPGAAAAAGGEAASPTQPPRRSGFAASWRDRRGAGDARRAAPPDQRRP
jgi:hypothetical protein